jgi:MFS superfamily sulfate permease-like transporter
MAAMVDHRTGEQKIWTTIVGVALLVGGVVLGALVYGNVPLTVVSGVLAVTGLGLLRYAFLRRLRARRA